MTGVKTFHEYNELTDEITISTEMDVEPILERNKEQFKQGKPEGDFWKAATIPNTVIERWIREKGVNVFNKDHWPAVKRLLNDPEWRHLRTGNFRL